MIPELRRLTLAFVFLLVSWPAAAASWEHVATLDGVRVSSRPVPGQDLPEFRGRVTINAPILSVLAVLEDATRYCEWMSRCAESRVLERQAGSRRIVYHRLDAPWPVADRDVVVSGKTKLNLEEGWATSSFFSVKHKRMPQRTGVVRMDTLQGFYRLKVIDDRRTQVTYQVLTDPGGDLPKWLARRATTRLPVETLNNLKDEVSKTSGQYQQFIERHQRSAATKGT